MAKDDRLPTARVAYGVRLESRTYYQLVEADRADQGELDSVLGPKIREIADEAARRGRDPSRCRAR
jgi:hypothetical protein